MNACAANPSNVDYIAKQETADKWTGALDGAGEGARGARHQPFAAWPPTRGLDLEDVNFERRPYDRWLGYGQSKTANVLFSEYWICKLYLLLARHDLLSRPLSPLRLDYF